MEGIYKDTPEVGDKLNVAALRAFSPISRALTGDGVVSATHIRNMGNSLDDLDLSLIERRLFDVMLLTLTMNGHLQAYNIGMAASDAAKDLDELLTNPVLPLRLVKSYAVLMVEHDLGTDQPRFMVSEKRPAVPMGAPRSSSVVCINGG